MAPLYNDSWAAGFVTAMVWLSDIFESHSDALVNKKIMRQKDIRLIVSIIDSAIKQRDELSRIGPRNMDLVMMKGNRAELRKKKGVKPPDDKC